MKFLQVLLCLIVISALFLEITASENLVQRQKAKSQRKSKKNIIDWLFGDWNDVRLEVTSGKKQIQEFTGKVRHVFFDQAFTIPFGIEFQNIKESKRNQQNNGFFPTVFSFEKLIGQGDNLKPILDLRLIKDCAFTDNGKDWFGDWTINFSVVGPESYQLGPQAHGSVWNVKMVMVAANREKALGTKDKIQNACVQRSKQVNALKAAAIKAGDQYYQLYQALLNRQLTLQQQVQQGQTQKQVLDGVKNSQALKSQQIQQQIAQNQQKLQDALNALKATQVENQGAQQDVEKYSASLEQVKLQLANIQSSQKDVQDSIVAAQSQLNEAIALQNSQKEKANQLAKTQQEIQAQQETEKAELARLVKEQEDRMKQVAEEFARKQAELLRQQQEQQAQLAKQQQDIQDKSNQKQQDLNKKLEDNKNQNAQVGQAIAASAQTIEGLLKQINLQEQQAKLIDEQRKSTESSIASIQSILEQKRNAQDQLNAKLLIQQAVQQQQDQALKATQAQGQKVLQELAAEEKKQLDRLDQSNKEVQAAQAAAKKASNDVNNAYLSFNNAINQLNDNAKEARVRTQVALEKSSLNQHAPEINAVVSNTGANIRRAMQRLAKTKKSLKRLAKVYRKQAKKVRLQRLKAKKNKLNKKSKKAKRAHKKNHKKQEQH